MPTAVMLFATLGVVMLVLFIGAMLAFLTGDANEPFKESEERGTRTGGNSDTGGAPDGPTFVGIPPVLRVPVPQQPSGPASEQPGNPAFHGRSGAEPQPRAGIEEGVWPYEPYRTRNVTGVGVNINDTGSKMTSEKVEQVTWSATKALTQRSGITVCVVGESFASGSIFASGWCDYAIYPELEVIASEFVPRYGQSSWKTFKKAIAIQPTVGAGVSFSLRNMGDAAGTVASLPAMSVQLAYLVRAMNLSAMGVLSFQRHLGANTNTLSAAFKAMDAALNHQSYTERMVFLGVVLVDKQSRTNFVNEVHNMEHITTIIVQTHMHGVPEIPLNVSSKGRCRVLPVSTINARSLHQDFNGAVDVVYSLRMKGDKFRLLFSTTMAVMMFVSAGKPGTPMKINDACERHFMMDLDVTCNAPVSSGRSAYDYVNKYAFATFLDGDLRYFATYESEQSLTDKLSKYVQTFSDGWAMFEVQRDVWKACHTNDYIRLELTALNARYNDSSTTQSRGR